MLNIVINGKKVKAQDGTTILDAIQALKIEIPTLCYHKELSPFGACRLCSVEVKTNGKWQIATSCNTPVENDMEIRTDTDAAKASRKAAAELLYYKYPETQAVKEIAQKLGVDVSPEKAEGHDCILCGLCVRTCKEIVGVSALTFQDRGRGRDIDKPEIIFDPNVCIGCGSCAYVCPTGYVKMETDGDRRIIWDKVFKMTACPVCGRYFAPEDQLKYIGKTIGTPLSALTTCVDCR
ncbi:MAG TPA: 2Fe-2S iron-sulfur cluster-binding protein [Syntrophales bacterium]|nr:2Fe-2S iron-sulfur cluster-binding protein [Syntrophales bacterium]